MVRFWKRLVFGENVQRTIVAVHGVDVGSARTEVRVHALENGRVGLELCAKSLLSYRMQPATLDAQSARALAAALERAAAEASDDAA